MPQISPIFWTLIVMTFTLFTMTNSETLPESVDTNLKICKIKQKENKMEW